MLFLVSLAMATSTGKTGVAETGCGDCHGDASEGVSWTLNLPEEVEPGDEVRIVAMLIATEATLQAAGLDVAVDGGTLVAGTNNQLMDGEITHTTPQPLVGGRVGFDFNWIVPETEGTYTLSISGNGVNLDGAPSGDDWASTTFTVKVDDHKDSAPESVPTDSTPTESGGQDSHDLPPPDEGKEEGCGCQSSSATGGFALGLASLLLGLRRRAWPAP